MKKLVSLTLAVILPLCLLSAGMSEEINVTPALTEENGDVTNESAEIEFTFLSLDDLLAALTPEAPIADPAEQPVDAEPEQPTALAEKPEPEGPEVPVEPAAEDTPAPESAPADPGIALPDKDQPAPAEETEAAPMTEETSEVPVEETQSAAKADAEESLPEEAEPEAIPEEQSVAKAKAEEAEEAEEPAEPEAEEAKSVEIRNGIVLSGDHEGKVVVYRQPDANSPILTYLSKGDTIQVAEILPGVRMSRIRLSDSLYGYIFNEHIALFNATREEQEIVRSITISDNIDHSQPIREGTVIRLSVALTGFEDTNYTIQWQYSPDDGVTAYDIPGATSATYAYRVNEENVHNIYRVIVNYDD